MDYNALKNKMKGEAFAEQEDKFYEMTGKGKLAGTGSDFKTAQANPFGPVSNAPSKTAARAKQPLGESGRTFTGKGGYEYGANADGSFTILKSGRDAAPGTVVKPGMKGYENIKKEFEDVKAGKSVSSKPRSVASKSAPKSEAPKSEAPKPRNPDTSKQIADRLEMSLDDDARISTGPTEYERTKARAEAKPPAPARKPDRLTEMFGNMGKAMPRYHK